MKKILFFMLAGTASLFLACGDDSSSDGGSSGGGETTTYTESGTLKLDDVNHRFEAYSMQEPELCVKEGFDYKWKKVNFGEDTAYFKYEFVDDTLVIYEGERTSKTKKTIAYSSRGQMYTGGSKGKIEGTWKYALCTYDSAAFESTCYKRCEEVGKLTFDEEEKYTKLRAKNIKKGSDFWDEYVQLREKANCLEQYQVTDITLKISSNSFTATTTHYGKDTDFDDYTNSKSMSAFYQGLFSLSPSTPSYSGLFEEDTIGVKKVVRTYSKYKTAIKDQSKNDITFQVKDNDLIKVSIKKVSSSGDINTLEMEVSHDGKKCELLSESGDVTKSNCNEKNGEYFSKEDAKDIDDNEIIYAEYYSKNNSKEFRSCVGKMMNELLGGDKTFDEDYFDDDYYDDDYGYSYGDYGYDDYDYGDIDYDDYYSELCAVYPEYCETGMYKSGSENDGKLNKVEFLKAYRKHLRAIKRFEK